ncbi:hypothetical protein P152DRAFT_446850 [Eremomyces bilateralis CBS 781.70]|uniref:Protein kinase domain-containing protein n=1 Tax=Eremomyces bilateralis CBS 781.70 TaxID=1392243 RepID=A0A6G1GCV7_9PEZI|nr:uncharacterized protein P152DRAFT_446850 [Eremomyces bilateralis CBS 781.70]KAF1815842.1 hypothetical protein P152DRAFT_446850 [Eremomyces bilateralis CBS 781.70]
MEPLSLAFAAVTVFKAVFLLSPTIYKVIEPANNAVPEKLKLCIDFHHEVLFLRDFGQRFLANSEFGSLDKGEGPHSMTFNDMNSRSLDYQALAAKDLLIGSALKTEDDLGCMMDQIIHVANGYPPAVSEALLKETKEPAGKAFGLAPFMSLKRITLQPNVDISGFELKDFGLQSFTQRGDESLALVTLTAGPGRAENVLAEYKEYGDLGLEKNMTAVNQLANLLAASYVNGKERHAFVFDFPENTSSASFFSLRSALEATEPKHAPSLETRFRLAERLAKTVWYLHAVSWLHKSIRSSNIVFFESLGGEIDFESPYLVGFEYARLEADATEYTGFDEVWSKNIYQHPARQGSPTTWFSKAHDVYALGLVLLEVVLWRPLADILAEARPNRDLKRLAPKRIQGIFQVTAEEQLGHRMGVAYAKATMECLSARPEDKWTPLRCMMI